MINKNTKYIICIKSYYEKDFVKNNIYKVEIENFSYTTFIKIYDEKNEVLFFDINSIFNKVIMPVYFKIYPIQKLRRDKIQKLNLL